MPDPINPHTPITEERRIACAAPECGYAMHRHNNPDGTSMDKFLLDLFHKQHAGQFDVGRAPDISIDWEISACCSVCEDGIGKVVTNDSETVTCEECGTTWDMEGKHGEREEQEDVPDEPDATGGLLDLPEPPAGLFGPAPDQPPIVCDACGYTTTDIREALDHARQQPGHALSGPGRLEGTTLTISIDDDDDDDDI